MTPVWPVCAWCAKPLSEAQRPTARHCDHVCRRRDWGERTGYDLRGAQTRLEMRSNALPDLPGQRPTARAVYAFLRARGDYGATTAELAAVAGIKFSSRISDLRAAGCIIARQQLRLGRWRYWLTHDAYADVELPAGARAAAAVPSDQRVLDLAVPQELAA